MVRSNKLKGVDSLATNKNITMKQFNGTDYDTLYPKTIASQVDNVYNKEEVISNATKTLYGLGSNATPDNAFKKISDKISNGLNELSKIGDIMITARKDLGDKWLLCNGDEISPSVYPELAEIIKGESFQQLSSTLSIRLNDVAVYNGIWVAVGTTSDDSQPYIFTTTDPTGTWTGKQLETRTMTSMKIACYNGTWVAVGYTFGGNSYPYIYTTTNPTGTWTGKQISTTVVGQIGGIACYNGTWVIAGASDYYYRPKIYTSTNPSGAWTETQISDNQTYIQDITCYNGTWVAVGYTDSDKYPYIYTTTNPTGAWTGKQLSSTITTYLKAVSCYNGTWVAVGYTGSGSNVRPYIYTTTTPTGTWSGKYIDSQTAYFNPYGIACYNGNWVMVGTSSNNNTIIYTATQPSGAWAKRIIFSTNIDLYGIESDGDTWVTCGYAGSPLYPWVGSNDYYLLPTISPDRSYAYIKALE